MARHRGVEYLDWRAWHECGCVSCVAWNREIAYRMLALALFGWVP